MAATQQPVTVVLRSAKRGWVARAGRGKRAKTASSLSQPMRAVRRAAAKFFHLCPICNVQSPGDLIVEELADLQRRTFSVRLP